MSQFMGPKADDFVGELLIANASAEAAVFAAGCPIYVLYTRPFW